MVPASQSQMWVLCGFCHNNVCVGLLQSTVQVWWRKHQLLLAELVILFQLCVLLPIQWRTMQRIAGFSWCTTTITMTATRLLSCGDRFHAGFRSQTPSLHLRFDLKYQYWQGHFYRWLDMVDRNSASWTLFGLLRWSDVTKLRCNTTAPY